MKYNAFLNLWILVATFTSFSHQIILADNQPIQNAYAFTLKDIHGKSINLEDYKGKVTLIVNVASKCGFTPQYKGLQALHVKYKPLGFCVLAFPCNNFDEEEPGTNLEILEFCRENYQITFPLMAKLDVQGENQSPLYKFLTAHPVFGGPIKWNFEKYLIDKSGKVVGRFDPETEPDDPELVRLIESTLKRNNLPFPENK